jgi:hypothetical protein
MTPHEPYLRLTRMVVMQSGHRAWDEKFHAGVNIIRSQGNSGGKSTIADLIFFGLGGDFIAWKPEAGSCDSVYCEVSLSGVTATLRREITTTRMQPMWVYFGDFERAHASGPDGWQRYGYTRANGRESFTQVLFRSMGMPEVPVEAESNLTIHQALRLMYVDQMTPVDRIFRFEANDSANRRQAVGDLLCGLFDDRIYPAQLRLREIEKTYEVTTTQLNALIALLSRVDTDYRPEALALKRAALTNERDELLIRISKLKRDRFRVTTADAAEQGLLSTMQSDLEKMNADISNLKVEAGQLSFQITDADELIEDVEKSLTQLTQADAVRGTLGPVSLEFCPSCMTPLAPAKDDHTCRLCHAVTEPEEDRSRYARMRNELAMQLKESSKLQAERREKLKALRLATAKMTNIRDLLMTEFMSISRNHVSEADSAIDILSVKVGYIERSLIDIEQQERMSAEVSTLTSRKAQLNDQISNLKTNIGIWTRDRDRKQSDAHQLIRTLTAEILAQDIQSESEFKSDSNVYFDFGEDRISVNDKFGFSASSLTIIRNAFHLALHLSSCARRDFKYPRFTLMDNIEDKGMTTARSQNFQHLILDLCARYGGNHQLIFTSSMLAPDLDRDDLTVGERYSFTNKSLKVSTVSSLDG